MPLPKYRKKLIHLFTEISEEPLRRIISEVIDLEYDNRSSHRFPVRKIQDIVDKEASFIEKNEKEGK